MLVDVGGEKSGETNSVVAKLNDPVPHDGKLEFAVRTSGARRHISPDGQEGKSYLLKHIHINREGRRGRCW